MNDSGYASPYGFGGLDADRSAFETSQFVVLPVPYEQTTTFGRGTKAGPESILRASRELELWDDDLGVEPANAGIHTLAALEPSAAGPREMVDRIRRAVGGMEGKIPVILGGEHTVSVGAVQALAERHAELIAVVLDAHADLRDEYQGSPYSHACTARRISEHCTAIEVGVRSFSREEAEFIREQHWPLVPARSVRADTHWISEVVAKLKGRPVYLSVDLDVLDPGIMPAVGTPEPGGMSWSEITSLTREIARHADIVAFDAVELAPIPGLIAPDFLAARLVYKIIGQIAFGPRA